MSTSKINDLNAVRLARVNDKTLAEAPESVRTLVKTLQEWGIVAAALQTEEGCLIFDHPTDSNWLRDLSDEFSCVQAAEKQA